MARGQLRVLHALDVARTQFYHFMTIVIAGMGFFTDAYDLFSVPLVIDHIGDFYYCRRLPDRVRAAITSIALCGTVPGALIFGWLGDKMGRKRIYGVTLVLMVACSLASGLSFSGTTRIECPLDSGLSSMGKDVIVTLCFFRFWLGVGIGGDYPLSATIMSEYANKRRRGALIAAIFSMQGFGIVAAGIATMMVSVATKEADYVWRVVLMLGSIPAALTYYWRMRMPETARYTTLIAKNANKAASDMSTVLNMHMDPEEETVNELERQDHYGLFSTEFLHSHGIHLIATSVCWLILDITFYSFNLFMTDDLIKPLIKGRNTFAQLGMHTTITLCSTVPGYFFTVAFIDRIGRVKIQLLGFAMMSVLTLGLAVPYDPFWKKTENRPGFAAIYALIFFFTNFGPNTTTFIIPAEIFPARLRSTCHGISAAAGKIGAIIGVFLFLGTKEHRQSLLYALVGCNLIGLLFTLLLPESKGKSLEEITGEMVEHQLLDSGAQAVAEAEYVHIVSS